MVRLRFSLITVFALSLAATACGKGSVIGATIVARRSVPLTSDQFRFNDANSESGSAATLTTPSFRLSASSLGGNFQKNTATSASYRVTGGVYGF